MKIFLRTFELVLVSVFVFINLTLAQEHERSESEAHDDHLGPKHFVSIELGHAHISNGFIDGEKHWLTVPSWAVNYTYMFNHKFGIGLQTDMIIESFKVMSKRIGEDKLDIERSFPLSFVGIAGYKPVHYLFFFLGGGLEYAPEETFSLLRIGVEPSIEINHQWELIFSTVYDVKIDAYNTWNLGIGVSRVF